MIKFFRKIRQNLLSQGKTGKYFKYAIGEIILVVIGILIALQVNNLNEARKENNLKQIYYQQILEGLETDKNYIEYSIAQLDSSITKFTIYNESFKEPDLPFPQILQNLLKNEINTFLIQFESTTIKSLINSGEIRLLDSEIRKNIINYNGKKELMLAIYNGNGNYSVDILKDVSVDGGVVIPKLENQAQLAQVVNIEQRYPELFIKLDAYHIWKSDNEERIIKGLKELITEIDIITEKLNNKLKK